MSTFIEQELKDHEDPDLEPRFLRQTTWRTFLCSKFAKGVIVALSVAIIVPTLAYFLVISRNVPAEDDSETYSCLIREEFRLPCGPANISMINCEELNCCFNMTTNECHHFLPSKYFYAPQDDGTYLTSQDKSPLGSTSLQYLKLTIQNKTDKKLSLIIHDPAEAIDSISSDNQSYSITQSSKKLILEVFDQDGDSIFSTAKGALIASEMYWEWSFQLSNGALFGLDRNLIQLGKDESLTKVIYKNKQDHSTLPVFWAYQNGKFHGAVIRHDGPLEIQVRSSNTVILRSLFGKKLEVELSLGPTPADLFRDQTGEMVLPPLWALGTHNCRKGDSASLSEIMEIYQTNMDSSFDTDCIHENLFMALQNSTSYFENELAKIYIEQMQESGKKFLLYLPPHILVKDSNTLYNKATELDLLYKNQSNNNIVYIGTYLNQKVVYPDFSNNSIMDYISTLINWIDDTLGMSNINGFVLNDNWPQDDSYEKVDQDKFPYYNEDIDNQMKYTLPWTLQGTDKVLHLQKHNSYGQYQDASLHAYLKTLLTEEPLIISSTKLYGDTEPEIYDNLDTSWDNFRMYLNKILFGSITGNRMVGFPVCGDTDSYNKTLHETLCMRWYIAAATMPYFRVSSGNPFRNPTNLESQYAAKTAETAMKRRALLQDYLFTIMSQGEPLVRPMYYDYFSNTTIFNLESQYTIGGEIIVAHPLSNGKVKLQVYMPLEKGVWYEFWGGTMFTPQKNGEYLEVESLETDWVMLVAQGNVVALTELEQFHLYIALNCSSTYRGCTATGKLVKDDNWLSFSATDSSITISGLPSECSYSVAYLRVYGYKDNSGYSSSYVKNVNLCGGDSLDSVTVNYIDE